jgi:hypothetical protein
MRFELKSARVLCAGVAIALSGLSGHVRAADLFSFHEGLGEIQTGVASSITYSLQFEDYSAESPTSHAIFDFYHFTTVDIGKTVTVDAFADSDFNAFVAEMTDGIPENLIFYMLPSPAVNGTGLLYQESEFIYHTTNDPRIDLHGYKITSFKLHLDDLSFTYDPSTDQSEFGSDVTITAQGIQIPEPATLAIASIGAIALLTRRKPLRGEEIK